MTPLYTPREARRCRLRARVGLIAACAAVTVCWGICALLCARVRTDNAHALFMWVLGLSTLSGWAAIALLAMVYRPARAESRHMAGILKETAACFEGALTIYPDEFRIPRGIRVRRASLAGDDGEVSLRLNARFAGAIPTGRRLRVYAARQFITGFEVPHEED